MGCLVCVFLHHCAVFNAIGCHANGASLHVSGKWLTSESERQLATVVGIFK